jgi:hypothetical protein
MTGGSAKRQSSPLASCLSSRALEGRSLLRARVTITPADVKPCTHSSPDRILFPQVRAVQKGAPTRPSQPLQGRHNALTLVTSHSPPERSSVIRTRLRSTFSPVTRVLVVT